MNILYDGFVYNSSLKGGGISRYFNNIIRMLPQEVTPHLPRHPNLKPLTYQPFRPVRLSQWFQQRRFQAKIAQSHPTLVHPTYYSTLSYTDLKTCPYPVVLTIWDMIHERFIQHKASDRSQIQEKHQAIQAAQRILCISENTKRDLLELYPIPEERICVTYLASEIDHRHSHGPEPVPERPYFLHVGARYRSYKNFDTLLQALVPVVAKYPDVLLVLVGPPLDDSEKSQIAGLKLTDHITHYGYAPDAHLAKLYRCSLALVYPSLYEGFGIPPLEAMACGTVVVASNCSSIPEVVGKAGLLFDPTSPDELTTQLCHLVAHPAQREAWIAQGHEQASLFSWEKTTAKTLAVYRAVV
jgi:glycosyltransferase involved in cell wall biosynthesis